MSHNVGLWRTDQEWITLIDASRSLSASSKISYKKQLRSTIRAFGINGPTALSTILTSPELLDGVKKRIADNSLRTYLAALVSLFKRGEEGGYFKRSTDSISNLHGIWSEALQQSSGRYHKRIDSNIESERERESHASLQDWQQKLQTCLKDDPDSQATLLIAFHALVFPPLRGGDLARVHIGYTLTGNCIFRNLDDESQTILLIRNHKTTKSYGTLKRVFTGKMVDILRNSGTKEPREWLFTTKGGTPYSESGFSSWKTSVFKDAFGRSVTTNSLRHEYISSIDRQNQSINDAKLLASAMGHGLYTQRQYVRLR